MSTAETRHKNPAAISVQGKAIHRPAPPRLGLTVAEAAQAVGMSESSFKRHVQPELRIVRRGSLRIIPLSEVEKWLERNATLAGPAGSRVR